MCPPGTGKTLMASSYQLVTLKAMSSSNQGNTSASIDKYMYTKCVFKHSHLSIMQKVNAGQLLTDLQFSEW